MTGLASIEEAVAAIGRGEIVVVVDDEDRENEGDLIMAAEFATPERIAFFLQHTSGVICATVTSSEPRSEISLSAAPISALRRVSYVLDRAVIDHAPKLLID